MNRSSQQLLSAIGMAIFLIGRALATDLTAQSARVADAPLPATHTVGGGGSWSAMNANSSNASTALAPTPQKWAIQAKRGADGSLSGSVTLQSSPSSFP